MVLVEKKLGAVEKQLEDIKDCCKSLSDRFDGNQLVTKQKVEKSESLIESITKRLDRLVSSDHNVGLPVKQSDTVAQIAQEIERERRELNEVFIEAIKKKVDEFFYKQPAQQVLQKC